MFLDGIALIKTLPCLAEPGKVIVVGQPSRTLEAVLPYLAALPGVITYNPEAATLTFRRQPGFLTLYVDRVYITQVGSTEEGLELLSGLSEAINATWEHRHELVAATSSRRAPRLLDVWSLLPRSNCTDCGEATCMAFASALLQHKRLLVDCPPMRADTALAERRAALEAML